MTKGNIVGLNQQPIETIQAGVLMALYQEFDLIIAAIDVFLKIADEKGNLNNTVDFTVGYAIGKTAKKYLSSLQQIQEELKTHDRKHCVMGENGRPVLNEDKTPQLLEGVTKEDFSKGMMEIMERLIPFSPHRIQPEAMFGIPLNENKSRTKLQIFKEYMVIDE